MRTMIRIVLAGGLLLAGFAIGLPVGRGIGFSTGSEWALVQAGILAREAGMFMPVYLKEGAFRIVVRQPRSLHKKARQLAEQYPGLMENVGQSGKSLNKTVCVAQRSYPTQ